MVAKDSGRSPIYGRLYHVVGRVYDRSPYALLVTRCRDSPLVAELYQLASIGLGGVLLVVIRPDRPASLFVFAACRYYGPDVKHRQWRFLTFGAIVALVIWLLASGAFAYYTSRFSSYNKTWGSLAAVVVMLTWLWISSVALLLGAEVDAETDRTRELQAPAKA